MTVDGNEAAASVAYRVSESIAIAVSRMRSRSIWAWVWSSINGHWIAWLFESGLPKGLRWRAYATLSLMQ